MVGHTNWSNEEFDVSQTGSRKWIGSVIVWRSSSKSAAHGRRSEGSAASQWATGDTIEMQMCPSTHISMIILIYL